MNNATGRVGTVMHTHARTHKHARTHTRAHTHTHTHTHPPTHPHRCKYSKLPLQHVWGIWPRLNLCKQSCSRGNCLLSRCWIGNCLIVYNQANTYSTSCWPHPWITWIENSRANTGAPPTWSGLLPRVWCNWEINLKECNGTTLSSWSPVNSRVAGYWAPLGGTVMLWSGEYLGCREM